MLRVRENILMDKKYFFFIDLFLFLRYKTTNPHLFPDNPILDESMEKCLNWTWKTAEKDNE